MVWELILASWKGGDISRGGNSLSGGAMAISGGAEVSSTGASTPGSVYDVKS